MGTARTRLFIMALRVSSRRAALTQGGKKLRSSAHIKTEPTSAAKQQEAEEEDDNRLEDELDDEVEIMPFTRNARQTRLQQRLSQATQPARAGKGEADGQEEEDEDDSGDNDEVGEHHGYLLSAHPERAHPCSGLTDRRCMQCPWPENFLDQTATHQKGLAKASTADVRAHILVEPCWTAAGEMSVYGRV